MKTYNQNRAAYMKVGFCLVMEFKVDYFLKIFILWTEKQALVLKFKLSCLRGNNRSPLKNLLHSKIIFVLLMCFFVFRLWNINLNKNYNRYTSNF